jgi:hypothetical protein
VALTKSQVNERYYSTVGGEIVFETEAQGFLHPLAVAKLIAARARRFRTRALKVLELGANNCAFSMSLLKILSALTAGGEVDLARIDYFAVELARRTLEVFLAGQEEGGDFQGVAAGALGSPLVGTLTRLGVPQIKEHLVHSEAGAFVRAGSGRYNAIVLNELLDDLPSRVFYSDAQGAAYELTVQAEEDEGRWRVRVQAESAPDVEMPPASVTATSEESLAVVRGAVSLLDRGGMLLIHDYGFVERYTPVAWYEEPPKSVPEFVTLEFPPGSESGFPRSFFRVFGNAEAKVVQITTDVPFAELIEELEQTGTVITLPHGNALIRSRGQEDDLRKGDGVFLSEFALLEPADDLDALLAKLEAEQAELRRRFAAEFLPGHASLFADLLYIKA